MRFVASLTLISLVLSASTYADENSEILHDKPPFALTVTQLKQWSPDSVYSSDANRSAVPLARRNSVQMLPEQPRDSRAKVLYAPDGMNNFSNYLTRQPVFNLFNFTHWADIDILNWFAGTATHTVQIPAKPWVETAHRNGVKVIGSVFMGVAQWGGNPDTVEALLEQDQDGRFIMADKLINIALYYGFDGWLMNQETDLTAIKDVNNQLVEGKQNLARGKKLAARMLQFMQYLTANAPSGMEIHWYDSMIPSGEVKWQNELNDLNKIYLQQDNVRSSDAIFLNYWWDREMVLASVATAEDLGRSAYDIYVGADLWPERTAQTAFSKTEWYSWLFDGKDALTSIAVFAPNFHFSASEGTASFGAFQNAPADASLFYQTEQRIFAGDDLNIARADKQGWPGLADRLAPSTPYLSLPFSTTFNVGQGKSWFEHGQRISGPWTDMNEQSPLPTWQFAVISSEAGSGMSLNYQFESAYSGGSALHISEVEGDSVAPLFATALKVSAHTQLSVVTRGNLEGVAIYLTDSKGSQWTFSLPDSEQWQTSTFTLSELAGQSIRQIGLKASSNGQKVRGTLGALELAE